MQNIAYKCTWVVSGKSRIRARAVKEVEFYQATALKSNYRVIEVKIFDLNFKYFWIKFLNPVGKVLALVKLDTIFLGSICFFTLFVLAK